jgi:hypothetical protein
MQKNRSTLIAVVLTALVFGGFAGATERANAGCEVPLVYKGADPDGQNGNCRLRKLTQIASPDRRENRSA